MVPTKFKISMVLKSKVIFHTRRSQTPPHRNGMLPFKWTFWREYYCFGLPTADHGSGISWPTYSSDLNLRATSFCGKTSKTRVYQSNPKTLGDLNPWLKFKSSTFWQKFSRACYRVLGWGWEIVEVKGQHIENNVIWITWDADLNGVCKMFVHSILLKKQRFKCGTTFSAILYPRK